MIFSKSIIPVLLTLSLTLFPFYMPAQNTTGAVTMTTSTDSSNVTALPDTTTLVEATTQPVAATPPANDLETTGSAIRQSTMPVSGDLKKTTDTVVTTASSTLAENEQSTAGITGETPTPVTTDNGSSVTLPEGVIYQVIKPGNGEQAGTSSTLLIHYTLYLPNGTKLESSRDNEFPLPFQFAPGSGEAIKGMELGTAEMKVGEQRKLFIPSHLGYGAKGQAPRIPPNSDLVFEIELVDIK